VLALDLAVALDEVHVLARDGAEAREELLLLLLERVDALDQLAQARGARRLRDAGALQPLLELDDLEAQPLVLAEERLGELLRALEEVLDELLLLVRERVLARRLADARLAGLLAVGIGHESSHASDRRIYHGCRRAKRSIA